MVNIYQIEQLNWSLFPFVSYCIFGAVDDIFMPFHWVFAYCAPNVRLIVMNIWHYI